LSARVSAPRAGTRRPRCPPSRRAGVCAGGGSCPWGGVLPNQLSQASGRAGGLRVLTRGSGAGSLSRFVGRLVIDVPSQCRVEVRSDHPKKTASTTAPVGIDPRMMTFWARMLHPASRLRSEGAQRGDVARSNGVTAPTGSEPVPTRVCAARSGAPVGTAPCHRLLRASRRSYTSRRLRPLHAASRSAADRA